MPTGTFTVTQTQGARHEMSFTEDMGSGVPDFCQSVWCLELETVHPLHVSRGGGWG